MQVNHYRGPKRRKKKITTIGCSNNTAVQENWKRWRKRKGGHFQNSSVINPGNVQQYNKLSNYAHALESLASQQSPKGQPITNHSKQSNSIEKHARSGCITDTF
ncbi:unnamed protein product [Ilex paraguariensis]|uniref:Uncharacterized protein n=1 Tax=Ilex paraguariensis TaxID=185542 RepID=A0ABC8RHD2_9AQUA